MSWFHSLSPELQIWIMSLPGEVATGIVSELSFKISEAIGRLFARPFQSDQRLDALQRALSEGLAVAISQMRLDADLQEHYLELFAEFIQRDAVIDH